MGYILIERQYFSPPKPTGKGITPNKRRIGFLDFLRELEDEDFPYDENTSLLIAGLEDVLLFARPNHEKMARELHQKLQRAAKGFEQRSCGFVQIEFIPRLQRGDKLWCNHATARLPIHLIFGSPPMERDHNENEFYRADFNLSSPT